MSSLAEGAPAHEGLKEPDPRPHIEGSPPAIAGVRCDLCQYPTTEFVERCPLCRSTVHRTRFCRTGTVFSGTVLMSPVHDRDAPLSLVYVDLDDGPRVLGHGSDRDQRLPVGERVILSGVTPFGDPQFSRWVAEPAQESTT